VPGPALWNTPLVSCRGRGVERDLVFALELADLADEVTQRHRAVGPIRVDTKVDGSPVTAADVEIEERMRDCIGRRNPDDGFLGEEVGPSGSFSRRWIVDGIDGTPAFAAGDSEWGTLIALEEDGDIVVGVATSPGLQRRWWGGPGVGAWSDHMVSGRFAGKPVPLSVSQGSWENARACLLPRLDENAGWRRSVGDQIVRTLAMPEAAGHGPLLVSEGALEVCVCLAGYEWDLAAFVGIVEGAGGEFCDLWGGRRLDTFTAVFANGSIADAVVSLVSEQLGSNAERWVQDVP
jgi:histidinol-phosphatase